MQVQWKHNSLDVDASITTTQVPEKSKRLQEIDIAKGIGILLVVIGHLVAVRSQGPASYAVLKTWIYQFHMPLFMCLSGFTFERYVQKYRDVAFGTFVRSRADRLLIPFAVFGTLIAGIKLVAAQFVAVDDAADSISETIYTIFIDTRNSPVLSIWYVWVLFVYSVIMLPVLRSKSWVLNLSFVISILMYASDFTDAFYINRVATYLIFFISGIYISMTYDVFKKGSGLFNFTLILAAFLASSVFSIIYSINNKPLMILVSIFAIPLFWYVSLLLKGSLHRLFLLLGKYSMAIYLINTLIIGIIKVFFNKIFPNAGFIIFSISATIAAIVIPILFAIILRAYAPKLGKYLL